MSEVERVADPSLGCGGRKDGVWFTGCDRLTGVASNGPWFAWFGGRNGMSDVRVIFDDLKAGCGELKGDFSLTSIGELGVVGFNCFKFCVESSCSRLQRDESEELPREAGVIACVVGVCGAPMVFGIFFALVISSIKMIIGPLVFSGGDFGCSCCAKEEDDSAALCDAISCLCITDRRVDVVSSRFKRPSADFRQLNMRRLIFNSRSSRSASSVSPALTAFCDCCSSFATSFSILSYTEKLLLALLPSRFALSSVDMPFSLSDDDSFVFHS